jgi:hypothetical protein
MQRRTGEACRANRLERGDRRPGINLEQLAPLGGELGLHRGWRSVGHHTAGEH